MRLLKRKLADDKLTQLVETGAIVVPDLPETFPADVNVEHYVSMAEKLVKAITEPETRESHTIPLAKLSRAQRDQFEANKAGAADPERCAALDLARYHADWANVVRGNPHDTMKHLLCRLWLAERGRLSRGDLVWVADQIDEASGGAGKAEWQRLADWIVRHVSPFPLSQTIPEHVARAMAWAVETIQPNKRRKVPKHLDVLRSDFVKADALERYEKTRDVYRLACSLCAVCVKNAARLSEVAIWGIIEEIDAYLMDNSQRAATDTPPPPPDDPRCAAWPVKTTSYPRLEALRAIQNASRELVSAPDAKRGIMLDRSTTSLMRFVVGGALEPMEIAEAMAHAAVTAGMGVNDIERILASALEAGVQQWQP